MPFKGNIKRTIPSILEAMNNTNDSKTIKYYDSLSVCLIASPIMFLSAVLNFIVRYLLWGEDPMNILIDSLFLLVLGILFEVFSRIRIDTDVFNHVVSFLYSIWLVYFVVRFYHIIGPAVWTIAFIQILLAMSRISQTMLVYICIASFLSGMYVIFLMPDNGYEMGTTYYIIQTGLFALLFVIASYVLKMNLLRYKRLEHNFIEVTTQKEEITMLYEEIAASEEELREQHQKLTTSNEFLKINEEKLNFLAYYDTLTELPNRKMIMERLDLLINLANPSEKILYIVFIDLDNFKKTNDTMGHHIGDRLVQSAANRMKNSMDFNDFLGRLGGDEFALIIHRDLQEEEVLNYIDKIRQAFLEPFQMGNTKVKSSASFGISIFPRDGEDAVELLKNADTAMYKAKEIGKNSIQFFRKGMKDEIIYKMEMENRLIAAYQNEEFFLEFQPQYEIKNSVIRGFEALIRWNSKELGIVPPMSFIPLAEEMGLIVNIGDWILINACIKFKELSDSFNSDLIISVNISTVQMKDRNFINTVRNALNVSGLNPKQLELEVTESIFIENVNQTTLMLKEIKQMGVKIALDDFGTGYSSLNYLRLLPIDVLKIDKSFIWDLLSDKSSKHIVGDIISLGHSLGLLIVAEGIENSSQLDFLKKNGCDYGQGFLLGKPMPEDDVKRILCNDM